jgi:hypothetical protein
MNASLSGTIPDSVGSWTELTQFEVSYNAGLHGQLPASMVSWDKLTNLQVQGNDLSGPLPALPYANMDSCFLSDNVEHVIHAKFNTFSCPLPAAANAKCKDAAGGAVSCVT